MTCRGEGCVRRHASARVAIAVVVMAPLIHRAFVLPKHPPTSSAVLPCCMHGFVGGLALFVSAKSLSLGCVAAAECVQNSVHVGVCWQTTLRGKACLRGFCCSGSLHASWKPQIVWAICQRLLLPAGRLRHCLNRRACMHAHGSGPGATSFLTRLECLVMPVVYIAGFSTANGLCGLSCAFICNRLGGCCDATGGLRSS